MYAYIEVYNSRYAMTKREQVNYIREEIRGAKSAGADGWIAWSAGNVYGPLFSAVM